MNTRSAVPACPWNREREAAASSRRVSDRYMTVTEGILPSTRREGHSRLEVAFTLVLHTYIPAVDAPTSCAPRFADPQVQGAVANSEESGAAYTW